MDLKRTLSSLLPAASLLMAALTATGLGACGSASYSRPDLPKSVAPGWTLSWYDRVSPPSGLPAGSSPDCWKAVYSGPGSANMWFCGYANETAAFDAVQRTEAAAQTVKFQEGRRLVLVEYANAKHADLESLIRTIQKRLKE